MAGGLAELPPLEPETLLEPEEVLAAPVEPEELLAAVEEPLLVPVVPELVLPVDPELVLPVLPLVEVVDPDPELELVVVAVPYSKAPWSRLPSCGRGSDCWCFTYCRSSG